MEDKLSREEFLQYSRHLLIPEVGLDGQCKLKAASVLIVGTGGLGSPAAIYLAAAGVGHIGLVDNDVVEESNLQRQILHSKKTLGHPKVESARTRLRDINPYIDIDIYNEPFTSENARQIAVEYDIIVDGTDNFPSRYLINDLCVLTGKPFVYGAVFRFDGQAAFFDARTGPCYRCLFPEPPPASLVPPCSDAGVLGVLPGTIGTIQATETIKYLLGMSPSLSDQLLLYNALDMNFEKVRLSKNGDCKVCGTDPVIKDLVDYFEFCGVPGLKQAERLPDDVFLSPQALLEKIGGSRKVYIIDVREGHELAISKICQAVNIPLAELSEHLDELNRDEEIILFCRSEARARRAWFILNAGGFRKAKILSGGINAWASMIDQTMMVY